MAEQHCVFGIHAVQAALHKKPEHAIELIVLAGQRNTKIEEICADANDFGLRTVQAKKSILDALCDNANHQGVVLKIIDSPRYQESDLEKRLKACRGTPLILALDGVQDPHNLGACLRTAEAMGVDMVIAPKDRACDITPVVCKVASGAAERIPFIRVTNLVRVLGTLKQAGLWVFGTAGEDGVALDKADFTPPSVLVMGSEGKGIRSLTRKACDHIVSIPMCGEVGSFNVSVACGICLYEITRQRLALGNSASVDSG